MKDIDSIEIRIRLFQPDGNYEFDWLPLSELMKLMKQPELNTLVDNAKAVGEALARLPSEPPE